MLTASACPKIGTTRLILASLLGGAALLASIPVLQAGEIDRRIAPRSEISLQIERLIDNPGALIIEGATMDRAALGEAYRARGFRPAWTAHPEAATALANALAGSATEGIDPDGNGANVVATALADPTLFPAARDILLTDRFIRYAGALAHGEVDPASTESDWALARPAFDPAQALDRVAMGEGVAAILRETTPQRPEYMRLRSALARYRQLAAAGGWPAIPAAWTSKSGFEASALPVLARRLAIEGDLPADHTVSDAADPALAGAIRHFQIRHGLEPDGHLGPATIAEMNVSAAERVEQLRIGLERMRAMPHDWPATRLSVNIPSASLVLFRDEKPVLTSRVVVGDIKHPTPVLDSAIGSVLFNPAWTVPSSIVRAEFQPRLARDPGYLAAHHFKLLGHGDGGSADIDWSVTDILANGWQVQQEPGPWNALGAVMLDFPSPYAVYLHDTPAQSFFARASRALSHGCVRVEQIRALTSALLGPWASPEAIDKIVAGRASERHALPAPMPIYLTYFTAFVDDDGAVQFRDDLYGRDMRLMAALRGIESAHSPNVALNLSRR
jgi:L,D-transpeptidase YcbB